VRVNIVIAIALILLGTSLWAAQGHAAELRGANSEIDEHALFRVVGSMYDLDPELLEAVAEVESAGQVNAVSPKGALGLMQLMPSTAARFRVSNARDPVENALGAARYLAYLRALYLGRNRDEDTDLSRILAAYNAGEAAVWRYGGVPPYLETQEYVGRVLWVYLLGTLPRTHQPHVQRSNKNNRKATAQDGGEMAALDELDSLRRQRAAARDDAAADPSRP